MGHGSHRPHVGGGGIIPPWSLEVTLFTDVSTLFLTLLTTSSLSDSMASTFSMASRLTSLTVTQGLALVQHPRELKTEMSIKYQIAKWTLHKCKWTLKQSL